MFWSKGWFTFPKRDSWFLFHVDKFSIALVLRNLLSYILSIKLTFHNFYPSQVASFFENGKQGQNFIMEWHSECYNRVENWGKKRNFLQVLGPITVSSLRRTTWFPRTLIALYNEVTFCNNLNCYKKIEKKCTKKMNPLLSYFVLFIALYRDAHL